MVLWALTCLLVFAAVWVILIYNRLVRLRNEVKAAWQQIDVQLKRRYDLIPNLVSVVRGYMDFEKTTLEMVTQARAKAQGLIRVRDRAVAELALSQALGAFFAVVESYPSLKSNENVMSLQEELVSTENRIAFARQFYNDLVANYLTRLGVFPDLLIASLFAFRPAEYFSAETADRAVPEASIGLRQGAR